MTYEIDNLAIMESGGVARGGTGVAPAGKRSPSFARALAAVCAAASVVALVGCAPEPIESIRVSVAQPRLALAQLVAAPEPLDATAVPGLFPQRIVPSGAPWISARWSQLPGDTAFNAQLLDWVRTETASFVERTGGPEFVPRASPGGSGGASRGCAAESTVMPTAALLADSAVAPVAESGAPILALNCDIVVAADGWLGMRARTTSVDSAGALTDTFTTWYSVDGGEATSAEAFIEPTQLGELGELLLASLGMTDVPTMYAPAAIARSITEAEIEQLALARLITDWVPEADGSLIFTIRLADLSGAVSLEQRKTWVRAGALTDGRVSVRVPHAMTWLSEHGSALLAAAQAAAAPAWQPIDAGRQTVDCELVPCIAVTFDDGPGAESARLLQVLAATHSAASFFLQGSATTGAPGIAAAELAAGHTVGNHSWNHRDFTTLTPEELHDQVMNTQRAIIRATGSTPRYLRPPYGALNDEVSAAIPLAIVLWSIDTNDWQGPGEDALVERVSDANRGDIILFHDTHSSTVDAMPRVIDELQDRGLELVTLDELLGDRPAGVRIFHQ